MATVVLTGVGGGFGILTAQALREAGHTVFGTLRDRAGRNAGATRQLEVLGVHVLEMDVTSDASVDRAAAEILATGERIDAVINNAGVGVLGVQETFTAGDLQRLFDVNVFGAHRVTRAFTPTLRAQGDGLLLFVSSLLGRFAVPFYGPYNASKWALEAIAENYSTELSGHGVDVAIVEPGGYPTAFMANLLSPSDADRVASLASESEAATQFLAGFEEALAGNPAQDPRQVADAIVRLVEAESGTRPFRTVVDNMGMGTHIEPYNAQLHALTGGIYTAFGIDGMLARRGDAVLARAAA